MRTIRLLLPVGTTTGLSLDPGIHAVDDGLADALIAQGTAEPVEQAKARTTPTRTKAVSRPERTK